MFQDDVMIPSVNVPGHMSSECVKEGGQNYKKKDKTTLINRSRGTLSDAY